MGGPGGLREVRRLCHWGPLVALSVVIVCSATAIADAVLWYWPLDTAGGSVNFIMLLNWTVMILYNYFNAMFVGPGYVPLGWTPVSAASCPGWAGLGSARRGGGGRAWPWGCAGLGALRAGGGAPTPVLRAAPRLRGNLRSPRGCSGAAGVPCAPLCCHAALC